MLRQAKTAMVMLHPLKADIDAPGGVFTDFYALLRIHLARARMRRVVATSQAGMGRNPQSRGWRPTGPRLGQDAVSGRATAGHCAPP
jgi:hypothetical protein